MACQHLTCSIGRHCCNEPMRKANGVAIASRDLAVVEEIAAASR